MTIDPRKAEAPEPQRPGASDTPAASSAAHNQEKRNAHAGLHRRGDLDHPNFGKWFLPFTDHLLADTTIPDLHKCVFAAHLARREIKAPNANDVYNVVPGGGAGRQITKIRREIEETYEMCVFEKLPLGARRPPRIVSGSIDARWHPKVQHHFISVPYRTAVLLKSHNAPRRLIVLAALIREQVRRGAVQISAQTLSWMTGISEPSVKRILRDLLALEIIEVSKPGRFPIYQMTEEVSGVKPRPEDLWPSMTRSVRTIADGLVVYCSESEAVLIADRLANATEPYLLVELQRLRDEALARWPKAPAIHRNELLNEEYGLLATETQLEHGLGRYPGNGPDGQPNPRWTAPELRITSGESPPVYGSLSATPTDHFGGVRSTVRTETPKNPKAAGAAEIENDARASLPLTVAALETALAKSLPQDFNDALTTALERFRGQPADQVDAALAEHVALINESVTVEGVVFTAGHLRARVELLAQSA